MSIPPSSTLAQLGQAHFKHKMDDCLYQLANNEIAAIASEVRITSSAATVKLTRGDKAVTVKLARDAGSSAVAYAVGFCQGFWSEFSKSVKPNKLVKYAIYVQAPLVVVANLAVSVFGLLIGLLGRITNSPKMRRMGAELAEGVVQPMINKVFRLLDLGR